jgi:hypothetical protein
MCVSWSNMDAEPCSSSTWIVRESNLGVSSSDTSKSRVRVSSTLRHEALLSLLLAFRNFSSCLGLPFSSSTILMRAFDRRLKPKRFTTTIFYDSDRGASWCGVLKETRSSARNQKRIFLDVFLILKPRTETSEKINFLSFSALSLQSPSSILPPSWLVELRDQRPHSPRQRKPNVTFNKVEASPGSEWKKAPSRGEK